MLSQRVFGWRLEGQALFSLSRTIPSHTISTPRGQISFVLRAGEQLDRCPLSRSSKQLACLDQKAQSRFSFARLDQKLPTDPRCAYPAASIAAFSVFSDRLFLRYYDPSGFPSMPLVSSRVVRYQSTAANW